ncbi:VanZ family protein [Flavobacterium sp. MDT1-60]|uniref:VanZ family protein n=1 Tax=Flavobacterium sp. MDT1-60 TaxID=1979344 RepID=UPI00177DADC3|nr:VanZ family protein [Flavobacterium sp. MDT1-60]QOG00790.1 VanZ family protein [Flavobacterium sp. MDT1-60]
MFHKILLLILFLIIGVVFYFSWLPDPSLRSETYLPNWLLNWSNHYYNLRTAIPFIAVGFLLEAYTNYKNSNELNTGKKSNFIQNICIGAIIVCIAEGGQYVIHKRSPDLMDVFYGIIGSIIGAVGYNLFKKNQKCETDINLRL